MLAPTDKGFVVVIALLFLWGLFVEWMNRS